MRKQAQIDSENDMVIDQILPISDLKIDENDIKQLVQTIFSQNTSKSIMLSCCGKFLTLYTYSFRIYQRNYTVKINS